MAKKNETPKRVKLTSPKGTSVTVSEERSKVLTQRGYKAAK